MRVKRLLAFVLAVIMLMSNTVTASATSSTPPSGNLEDVIVDGTVTYNEDGSITVTSEETTGEEDDGTESTPPSVSEEENIISGDNTNQNTNPEGDTGESDAGESDNPNGEVKEGDDSMSSEEGEEITPEEPLPEEVVLVAPEVLLNEGAVANATDVCTAFINGEQQAFASIGEAVKYIDSNGTAGASYSIMLSADQTEIEVAGSELVSTSACDVQLYFANSTQTLKVKNDGSNRAAINIFIKGERTEADESNSTEASVSTISVADGVTLQFLENTTVNDTRMTDVAISFEGNNGTLEIGSAGQNETTIGQINEVIWHTQVDYVNLKNLYVYDYFTSTGTDSVMNLEKLTINLDSCSVDEGTAYEKASIFGTAIIAKQFALDGQFDCDTLTVNESAHIVGGSCLELHDGKSNFTNLTATDPENASDFTPTQVRFVLHGSTTDNTQASLGFSGSVSVGEEPVFIEKLVDYIPGFEIGDTVATISNEAETGCITAGFFQVGYEEAYGIVREDDALVYQEYAYAVYNTIDQSRWGEPYKVVSLAQAREYIENDNTKVAGYTVALLKDVELSENIDFSNIQGKEDKPVYFNINYKKLTIASDISVQAATFQNGDVYVNEGCTLTLLSSGNTSSKQMKLIQVDFEFEEKAAVEKIGGLVVGTEGEAGQVEVYVPHYVNASSNTSFTGEENVNLTLYDNFYYKDQLDAMRHSGYIDADKFEREALSFKNMYVKGIYNDDVYTTAQLGVPVTTEYLELESELRVYSLSADNMAALERSDLVVAAPSVIGGLIINSDNDYTITYRFKINLQQLYKVNTDTILSEGSVTLKNSLTNNLDFFTCVDFNKVAYDVIDEPIYSNAYLDYNDSKSGFADSDVVAIIDGTNAESDSALLSVGSYGVLYSEESPLYLELMGPDEENQYELVAYKDVNDIRLYDNRGLSRGFSSLESVKKYITGRNKSDADYQIYLNKNCTVTGDELAYNETCANTVELYLNNNNLTLGSDCTVKLDAIRGCTYMEDEQIVQPNSKITIGKHTLTIVPRSSEAYSKGELKDEWGYWWPMYVHDFKIVSDRTTPGSLVLGNASEEHILNSNIDLSWITFQNKLKDLSLYGNVYFYNDSTLTVTNQIYVKNVSDEEKEIYQEANLDGWVTTTKNLDARNGQVALGAFEVTGTSYFTAGNCLAIMPISYTELNNIVINADENDPYKPLNVDLRTTVELDDDNLSAEPVFSQGEKLDYGHLIINGTISTNGTMHNPIGVNRFWHCEWVWDGELVYVDEQELFEDGETILIANNAATTAKYFSIQGDNSCTKKVGNEIVADRIRLEVIYNDDSLEEDEPDISVRYTSLEDAVVNMPTDFSNAIGNYTFVFYENMMLSQNVTIPSFVTGLNLATGEVEEEIQATGDDGKPLYGENNEPIMKSPDNDTYYRRYLDLNGKKITTSACVNMSEGLRINSFGENDTALQGQFVINAVSDEEPVLNIDEDRLLADYNEEGVLVELSRGERDVVLRNVLVTAKSGKVRLWTTNKNWSENEAVVENNEENPDDWWYTLDASFDVKSFEVDGGYWNIGEYEYDEEKGIANPIGGLRTSKGVVPQYIKTVDLRLNGNGHSEWVKAEDSETEEFNVGIYADTQLLVPNLTINGGYAESRGRLEVCDTLNLLKSRMEIIEGGELQAEDVAISEAKLLVHEAYANVRNKLSVTKAYAGDSLGDYTVENNGQLRVNNLSMTVGTLLNRNVILAKNVSVCNFIAGESTSLICDTFANTGKATFHRLGRLLVNGNTGTAVDGTLKNVYLQGYGDSLNEYALIGRSSDAIVNLTGTFTAENEGQRAIGFESDSFVDYYDMAVLDEPLSNDNLISKSTAAWDGVWLSIMENPYYEVDKNNPDTYRFNILKDGEELFTTSIAAFPTDMLRVLGRDYWFDEPGKALYQDGKSLKVIGEYIKIHAELPNGDRSYLKSFTNWKDASAYLNTLNSKTTTYIVEILEDIDIGQTLDLPSNVKQIIICSGKGSWKSIDSDPAKTYWEPQKIKFRYRGGITLKTNTGFENILLDAYTLDKNKNRVEEYHGVLDTKGKTLVLDDVQLDFSDKEFSQVKGTSSTRIELINGGNISAATKISGIGEIYMRNGAYLGVTNGLSVNNIIIDKIAEPGVNTAVSEIYVADQISFKANLEVKKLLEMNSQASIKCDGTMKYADIISNTEGNVFITPLSNGITITGSISSPENMGMNYLKPVTVEIKNFWGQDEQVTGYALAGDEETTDYRVMKHAIKVSAGTRPDGITDPKTKLLTAEKVSPIWFVVEAAERVKTADNTIVYGDLVHKKEKIIFSGLADPKDTYVLLYAVFGENQMYLNSFGTLQDAFTEIDKIGGPDISFKIEVTADDDAIVKNKLGNYTFPSKAAEVRIVGEPGPQDRNGIITLNYKNALTLKSNVVLENVELNPFTTNTISLGSYDAVLNNVTLNDYLKTSISGSGTNKGSMLSLVSVTPMHITGDVTNVDTLVLDNTDVQVDGKISAGTLILPEDEVITCLGTAAIGDVYTVSGTIQTIPVYTLNKKKDEIIKVSSNLTISGDVLEMPSEGEGIRPELTITFVEVNNGEITGEVDLSDETFSGLVDSDGVGITIAKAVNVDTDAIGFGNTLVKLGENGKASPIGTIYKKSGSLVYKCSDPVILLQYVDNNGSEVETLCESFADAVTEINNLKTKREYTMGIYDSVFNAGTLAMPNAKYVDTVTICPVASDGRAEIRYMNNITFTSNVVLENIDFVQIVKNGTEYEPVDKVKAETGAYPGAVSVSVSGAYFLSIVNNEEKGVEDNTITFNTPITLNGNKKAILNIGEGVELQTCDVGSNYEPWAESTSLVQGRITGFAEMNVFSPISLYGYSSLNRKKVEAYNATELYVTNLNVWNGAAVIVGQEVLNCGDRVTVTNLNLAGGTLETTGTGTFTNVVLGDGVDKLAVYGQTFNINGNLTCLTSDAELVTGLTKKSESALYVKGNVVLGDAAIDGICVRVTENGVDSYILGQINDEGVKNSTLLLKAKTAPIDVFRPSTGEEEGCVLEDNEYDPATPESGYILKKTGESIQVCYGSEIGVALCGPVAENGVITDADVINYYPTYNDAVAAIEALKDVAAEYTIVVIQPVGTKESPVALSMPSKAAKVTVVGYAENGDKEVIYYTNAPALKTDMVFANVTLAPEKVSKKVVSPTKLGITTNNFDITLQDIAVTGENAGIAKITGKNTATIKLDSEALEIEGDISAAKEVIIAKNATVTGSVIADAVTVEADKTIAMNNKFTAKVLNLKGASVVDAQKAAVTITDIVSVGDSNKIIYGQDAKFNPLLTIKGNIDNALTPITLDMKTANLKTLDTTTNPAMITLAKEAKLATVEKESLDKLKFILNGMEGLESSDYCWANKGVYRISEMFIPVQIKDEEDAVITYCLDFAQAVNYINAAADKTQDYVIDLTYGGRNSVDVNLTDNKVAGKSAITMPGKDKAESVKILGLHNGGTKLAFSGNIATFGDVVFENIWLLNDNSANFTIANKKDANGDSSLTLIDTVASGKAVIKSISGEKGITDIEIRIEEGGIYPSESYGAVLNAELVNVLNSAQLISFTGVSAVDNLTIAESKVQTTGKATVGTLNLQTNAAWEAKAATTVATIAESKSGSYIETFHSVNKKGVSTGLPQFTVTGNVVSPIQMKVSGMTDYANQKLVLAKAESADKFIATEYGYWNDNVFEFTNPGSEQAYKDKSGYVSNGNINAMEVLLSELNGEGTEIEGTATYVATYAEAIQVINNSNNRDASYQVLLRNTTLKGAENGNDGVIKTALSGTASTYGTLALPAANKAASIRIIGESNGMEMKYTSGLKPNCDVTFENITLTEGSLDKKGNYTELNYITPNLDADVKLTFAGNVKTLGANDGNLVFNGIRGKKGEIAFATSYDIESKGAISIADISAGDGVRINLHTYFTNKVWKKAATQLSINGDVQLGENSKINVVPHIYDVATKAYNEISDAQMTEMLISASAIPASWQKVITAPKMQTMDGKITLCNNVGWKPVKYNGGIYFTNEELPVVLRGGKTEIIPDQGDYRVEYKQDYVAQFLTWEEAIKEIDRINTKKTYVIELYGDLGTETPITTLTMPSKASELIVLGIEDANDESPDIMMTGTAITAKCNVAFDNVGITAVKKAGNNYYSIPFTLNTGNFEVEIEDMPDMCRFFMHGEEAVENCGEYDSEMKVTGSTKGSFTYTPCEVWYDADESGFVTKIVDDVPSIVGGPDNYVDVISQISKVGNVTLNTGNIVSARWDNEGNIEGNPVYAAYYDTNYYIPNGISGVNSFMIMPDVRVDCAKADFTVKDLTMGNIAYAENGDLIENADARSGLTAKNITVSGLLTMASSEMHAGTSTVGDGKVTLTNVIFSDKHNAIEGKQDKNGNSLIQIKGTVGTDNEDMRICDSAVTIGLYYNNSSQNYVRLSEGMNLLTAPKAASSWFRPNYGYVEEGTGNRFDNMGWEITVEKAVYDEAGELNVSYDGEKEEWVYATEEVPTYGLYKSGNNITYGQICEVFEYEHEHVLSEEESVILNVVDVRDMAEARLWIGTNTPAWDSGESAYLDFMTFEEAVKAIDSLNQKTQTYCIELLRTVEIGNTAGNGKYSSLVLPSKAGEVTICGNGENSLVFAGNIALKCNTVFENVQFSPVKLLKNEVMPADVNITVGNYTLMWNHSDICFAYQEEGEWIQDYTTDVSFANIIGSSKGSLIVVGDSCLSANNVTGFGKIEFTEAGEGYGWIFTEGNVQANEIHFTDGTKAKLRVLGNTTVNIVYLDDDVDAQFRTFRDKTLKINGAQIKDKSGNLMKDENGKILYDSVVTYGDEELKLFTYEPNGTTKNEAGSKLVTGKYLDAEDWNVYAAVEYDMNGNETLSEFSDYTDAACAGLYLGKSVVQAEP